MKTGVQHGGDCSIWISPICDCGALRRKISSPDSDCKDEVYETWAKHLSAIDKVRDDKDKNDWGIDEND